jgi:hypothetical protein
MQEPKPGSRCLYAGHRLASKQVSAKLFLNQQLYSVLMSSITFDTFTAVHLCSSSLVHTCHLYDDFSVMLTTRAFDQRRLRWFAPCSCKPSAKGLPSSLALLSTAHSHYVILPETVQDFADIFFKGFDISRLEFHQFILHFVPKLFNAIEFWTVRRQKIERQPLLSLYLQHWLNCFRFME